MWKLKRLSWIIGLILLVNIVNADSITLKYNPAPHPTGEYLCWFEIPNFIIIYDYDSMTDEQINQCLIHEYSHYLY